MSAGAGASLQPDRDLARLAPRFRAAVESALSECGSAGLDAFVYESYRSQPLQEHYFARGRTIVPPTRPVTNARSNLHSWHGFGLAVDVISRSKLWGAGDAWFADVAEIFQRHECRWGGEWQMRDLPHFQWHACKPSPSDRARELLQAGGLEAVWIELGAADPVSLSNRDVRLVVTSGAQGTSPTRLRVLIDDAVVAEGVELPGELALGEAAALSGKRIEVVLHTD